MIRTPDLQFRKPHGVSQCVPDAHKSPVFLGIFLLPCLEKAFLKRRFRSVVGDKWGGRMPSSTTEKQALRKCTWTTYGLQLKIRSSDGIRDHIESLEPDDTRKECHWRPSRSATIPYSPSKWNFRTISLSRNSRSESDLAVSSLATDGILLLSSNVRMPMQTKCGHFCRSTSGPSQLTPEVR